MTITNENFRRTETMLMAAGLPAEPICTLIALAMETGPTGLEADDIAEPDIVLPLAALAERLGMDRRATMTWLRQQNAFASETLGFALASLRDADDDVIDPGCGAGFTEPKDPGDDVVIVPILADIILGRTIDVVDADQDVVEPDVSAKAMIDLLGRATLSGGASVFYRHPADAGARDDDIQRATHALAKAMKGQIDVWLQPAQSRVPATASLLCVCLHAGPAAILMIAADLLTAPSRDTSDEFMASHPSDQINDERRAWRAFSVDGERLLRMLPHVPITILVAVPQDVVLLPRDAARFVTAVGPFRPDRQASVALIQSMASFEISGGTAERLVDLWKGSPTLAKTGLDAATRIVDTDNRGSASPPVPLVYNALTTALTIGIAPHVWSPSTLTSTQPPEVFYRELFICEPSADLLFSPSLRGEQVKILLSGEPGTGKSAACGHIAASVFGMGSLAVRASDVLHYRLGELERAVARCFRQARDENVILILDEADSLAQNRYDASPGALHIVTALTNQLLLELDTHPLPVFAATNFVERLDPALTRRIDLTFEVKPIPEDLEGRALALVLGIEDPPRRFDGFGGDTVISDYIAARKIGRLRGGETEALIAAVHRARDVRRGRHPRTRRKIGF